MKESLKDTLLNLRSSLRFGLRGWSLLLVLAGVLALAFSPLAQQMRAAAAPPKPQGGASPNDIWQELASGGLAQQKGLPAQARTLRLNREALLETLNRAPMEFKQRGNEAAVILPLPLPDGSFGRFRLEESPMMEPALARRFPEIKSYRAQGIDDPSATARLDWSPRGFHAFVLLSAGAVSIQPARADDATTYVSYASQDLPADADELRCLVAEKEQANAVRLAPDAPAASVGGTLRVYRVAIATTQEYTNQANLGGGSVANTLASLATWLSGINAILEKEVAVRLVLVGNNNLVIFTAEPDGFTNGDNNTMINEVPDILSANIGSSNYDIGHVFGTIGGGGKGLAGVAVVCDNSAAGNGGTGQSKARGATLFSGPSGQSGQVGVITHEFGHELGATHTFNAIEAPGTNCAATNRTGSTAYETGSGSTLMSYGGICQTNNLSGKEFRLHAGSFAQITTVLNTATCNSGNWIATGNNVPTINAGGNFTIPKQTPFMLTASGSDADAGDVPNLTYTWDQIDAGSSLYFNPPYGDQPGDPSSTTRPLFRPFPATTSPSRIFPSLTYILNNANVPPATIGSFVTGENLPSVARTMNYRATIRDNRSGGGGVNEATAVITVDGNAGPFLVTAPNTAVTWTGGTIQNVTWSVNNTLALAATVKISLSTDGGLTFPTVLAASAVNSGLQAVTVPNGVLTSLARIKVEAVGNIFFDISDANFSITPGDGCAAVSGISPSVGNVGNSVVISGINFTGTTAVKFSNNVSAAFTVNNNNQLTATVPAGAVTGPITISKTGCTDRLTGTFTVCPNPPATLQYDGGFGSNAFSIGANGYFVLRATPAAYPATLSNVGIQFSSFQQIAQGSAITVIAAANPSGSTNINGVSFQTVNTTIAALDQFVNYAVAPLTINTGDFVVGFIFPGSNGFPGLHDNTPTANRSYSSNDGSTFSAAPGDLLIRPVVFTGNCGGGGGCPTITVNPANPTLTAGTTGTFYTQTFTQTGGTPAITWSVSAGTLPTGLTLNANSGVLSGTPTVSGSFSFTIKATDANGCMGTQAYTLQINCPTITVNPSNPTLPAGMIGVFYTQTFTQTGGAGTITWSVSTGTLPSNVSLNSVSGVLSGTPTTSGTFNFTIRATDSNGCFGERAYQLVINGCPTITVNPANPTLPGGTTGTFYTQTFTQTGGTPTITWSISAGALPGGLSLNPSSGVLSGTPTGTGTFNFTVRATDSNNCSGERAYSLTITGTCPTITVNPATLPNGFVGTAYNQTFTATGGTAPYTFTLTAGTLPNGLTLTAATGGLAGTPTTQGTFNFTIQAAAANNCTGTRGYTVIISGNGLQFYPLAQPIRLLETRPGQQGCDTPGAPIQGQAPRTEQARVTCGGVTIPANAQAIAGIFTVVNQLNNFGYGTLYPAGGNVPNTANLNYTPQGVAFNSFITGLNAAGQFNIFTFTTVHVVIDVTGYFAPPGAGGLFYHALPQPIRLLETRAGQQGCDTPGAPIQGQVPRTEQARVTCGGITIPNAAQAITGSFTVVNQLNNFGYGTLYPTGGNAPNTANLNYVPSDVAFNSFITGLNGSGQFNIFTFTTVHAIIDVDGYFSPEVSDTNGTGLLYTPLSSPIRLLETRAGQQGCDTPGAPLQGQVPRTELARVTCGGVTIPATAQAITGIFTVVNQLNNFGYGNVYPTGGAVPNTANLNYVPFGVAFSSFITGLNGGGQFNIFVFSTVHVIIDVAGYFAP